LSDSKYAAIRATPYFVKVLENETKSWESTLNTEKRTALKAAAMFEEILPHLYTRTISQDSFFKDQIEAAKLVAKIAGIGEKSAAEIKSASDKFAINITIGGDKVQFIKDITPVGEASGVLEIQEDTEGDGGSPS